jgi:hypothetical protein
LNLLIIPLVIPAKAGIYFFWIPVFTGTSLDSLSHARALKRYACLRVAATAEAGRASTGITEWNMQNQKKLS